MASLIVPVIFKGPKGNAVANTLIDTGAEMSLISHAVATKIGSPILGQVSVHGAGRAVVDISRVTGIEIPGAKLCKVGPTLVWVFGSGVNLGTGVEAILGYDFMQKARMEIAAFSRTRALRCRGRK